MMDISPLADANLIYQRLALSLGIGFLVGLERGWHNRDKMSGTSVAGVRTFTLMGFLGGLAGLAGTVVDDALTLVIAIGFFGFVVTAYVTGLRPMKEGSTDKGMTTEVAALITFVLGLLAVRGDMTLAAVCTVVLVAMLNLKTTLHNGLMQIQAFELQAAIKLLLISVVVLPFLPNQGFGPAGIWNPFEIWWMVVLIAGISFAGYFAIKIVGTKTGPLIMGLLGGLASSTALSVAASRFVAKMPKTGPAFSGAIAVSAAVSFARTYLLATLLYPPIGLVLAVPLLVASLVAVGGALIMQLRLTSDADIASDDVMAAMGSPDDFAAALKFGAALFGVITLAHYATEWLGPEGLYSVAALSGLVDVDAVTLSVSRMAEAGGDVSVELAALAILIAVFVNSVVKVAIGGFFAGWVFARGLALIFSMAFGAAILAFMLL
jgi:uncharacterized membrane protein (DUF4010 family)